MSHERVTETRPVALAKAGLTPSEIGRWRSTYHPDGSVEFAFFSKLGNKRFLAHVMADPTGTARTL